MIDWLDKVATLPYGVPGKELNSKERAEYNLVLKSKMKSLFFEFKKLTFYQ